MTTPQETRILVVDDDTDIQKLICMRLNAAGYSTVSAQNGLEALAVIEQQQPVLVLTDLRMPDMDGIALLEAIRRKHVTLPVIMLTAHGSIPDAVKVTQQGAFGFLTKPFDSQELLQQVANALRISGAAESGDVQDQDWRAQILTRSSEMEGVLRQAKLVAATDASVFIQGESGSGKELLARAIHAASPRADNPFVAINCGAIPENLLESELFGHVKGAFTGAVKTHAGLFQSANGGTLFLDEIGDMPGSLQVKVLRALQERLVRAVGSTQDTPVDVRLISATHRDLNTEMREGRFREDLFYRINVVSLRIPSLAERREDIPLLANHFIGVFSRKYRKTVHGFAPDALETLIGAAWAGNVRQLQNVIEQMVVLATTPLISLALVQRALHDDIGNLVTFDVARQQFEHQYLSNLLKTTQGNVALAAKIAKRNRTEFYNLLKRHQLDPKSFQPS